MVGDGKENGSKRMKLGGCDNRGELGYLGKVWEDLWEWVGELVPTERSGRTMFEW